MENQETFKIEDLKGASWALRKIKECKESILEKEELAKIEKERIDNWLIEESKSDLTTLEYFNGLLMQYYKELKQSDPKAKISTPYGKVTSRKNKKWNYGNEETLLKYLNSNGYKNLIRTKQEINKTSLKESFLIKDGIVLDKNTGEVIPEISIVEEENINVKVVE
ncbi:host-nuclease inhibitor Gam family protein [Clostridium botulinum]|uniref:host-nuclease inhibitor Gam family protein n=1 Tax=Clostridium botulinum TaxID=1491 RepID=UPI001C9B1193|nr:host-nuclease inhibitor Gam family protein [Clostridium botulinum]MBY6844624.1 host-nuclease inhibitor Gam family protein [Clostridium botulinum]